MKKYINRLIKEWQEHSKIILAIDFDSTLSPWETIDNSEDIKRCIQLVKDAQSVGTYNVIFTACSPERYEHIQEHCKQLGIHIDKINENPIELKYGNQRKIYFNHLLDDRAGFQQSMDILESATYYMLGEKNKESILNQKF